MTLGFFLTLGWLHCDKVNVSKGAPKTHQAASRPQYALYCFRQLVRVNLDAWLDLCNRLSVETDKSQQRLIFVHHERHHSDCNL